MIVDPTLLSLRCLKQEKKVELNFLLLCRNKGVYPAFIRNSVSDFKRGHHFNRSGERSKAMMLRGAIKDTRSSLAKCDLSLYRRHQELANITHPSYFERMDIISNDIAMNRMTSKLKTLKKKLTTLLQNSSKPATREARLPILDAGILINTTIEGMSTTSTSKKHTQSMMNDVKLPPIRTANTKPCFVNLSSDTMDEYQTKVLNYNLHFSIAPQLTPTIDLIAHLETSINKWIPEKDKDMVKAKTRRLIESFTLRKNPKHALIQKCCTSLKEKDVCFLKADKGGQLIAVDREIYEAKTKLLLSDNDTYRVITKDPLKKTVNNLKELLRSCDSIDKFTKERMVPPNQRLPYFYAVPKIHKEGIPYRPVIANCGSIYEFASKFITGKIAFLTELNEHTIKNGNEFVTKLHEIKFVPKDMILSIDVISLYSKVPTQEAIEYLEELLELHGSTLMSQTLRRDIIKLTRFCVDTPFFKHRSIFYQQLDGLAMGSSLSSPLADIFMMKIDRQIANYKPKPSHYFRYVDDGFVHWPHGPRKLHNFLAHLNTVHTSIQFTWELEQERILPYLDVLVTRSDHSISTSVYHKPYASNYPPHEASNHPWPQKMSAFRAYTDRAFRYSDKDEDLQNELRRIERIAEERGYNKEIVTRAARKSKNMLVIEKTSTLKTQKISNEKFAKLPFVPGLSTQLGKCFKPYGVSAAYYHPKKIQHVITTHKDRVATNDSSGVYRIPCDCGSSYIGQTRRKFSTRKNEHFLATKSGNPLRIETSAVATHAHLHHTHKIQWDKAQVIQRCDTRLLNIHETIAVFQQKDNIINGKKDLRLNPNWKALLCQ